MRFTTYATLILCAALSGGILPFAAMAQTYTATSSATTTMSISASSSVSSSSVSQSSGASTTDAVNSATSSARNGAPASAAAITAAIAASHLYYYVNTRGLTAAIIAPDATTALTMATDIDPHSGVALGEGSLRPGMKIESVK